MASASEAVPAAVSARSLAASARGGHPAWEVLDRARVESLLTRAPGALDTMSRYYVWRLATVLLPDELG